MWDSEGDVGDDGDILDWRERRNREVARLNDPEAEIAGRGAWDAATRDGTNLAAPTPLDVRSLGAAQLDCGSPSQVREILQQIRAGGRGAADAVFLGHANETGAAAGSVPALFSGDSLAARYDALLQQGRDQDRFDEIHYPLARGVGEVAGTIGSLVATDGLAAAAVPRFGAAAYSAARAMPAMTRAERASVGLGGAGLGVAGQGLSDWRAGHLSDWTHYAASALGGLTAASSAARLGPVAAGASGALVSSLSDSALNGYRPSLEDTSHGMVGGGYLGAAGRVAGEQGGNRLDFRDKGDLGETLSEMKSLARGHPTVARQIPKQLSGGGRTILDSEVAGGPQPYVESKFGPTTRLSPAQRRWQAQNPGQTRNDYWMPHHLGQIGGAVLSSLGVPMIAGWDQFDPRP